ncbi:MAG: T9SS type A sorting domain-containing protein [Candidatus Kapaibacterium sp.]
MKTRLTLVLSVLLLGYVQTTRSQQTDFSIKTNRDTINITAGDTAKFNIIINVPKDFNASVFLSVIEVNPSIQATVSLSAGIVNAPYTGTILSIGTKEGHGKGVYAITISGSNGNLASQTTCYVNITDNSSWRVFSKSGGYSRPKFIFQDKQNKYYYNSFEAAGSDFLLDGAGIFLKGQPINWFEGTGILGGYTIFNQAVDTANNMWFATGKGLVRFDGTYTTIYNTMTSRLPSNRVLCVAVEGNGTIWAGTDKGLARLSGTEWTVFDLTNSTIGVEVITGIAVSGQIIWIGTQNGLAKYDGSLWTRITPQNSTMPAAYVWSMAAEANGSLWLGLGQKRSSSFKAVIDFGMTDGMIGLAKFDGVTWNLYNNSNSPMNSNNYINSIAIDKHGNKWIATKAYGTRSSNYYLEGCGLLKFDNTTWTAYTSKNSPLPSDEVEWVGTDNDNNVWFTLRFGGWGVLNENGLPPFLAPSDAEEQPDTQSGTITITPNPSSTTITISGTDAISAVTIVNSFGMEVVGKQTISNANGSLNVDVSDLASGVYFVQLRTPTGKISKPIVVMH